MNIKLPPPICNFLKVSVLLCAVLLLQIFALPSCSSETSDYSPELEEGIPTTVSFSLSALSNNGTRADEQDGTPKDPNASVELIHDWWIAFVAKNGDVKVIKRDEVADRTTSTSVNFGDGFEAETFRTTLPSGTYRIYAFANIDPMTADKFKKDFLKEPVKVDDEWKHKDKHLNDLIDVSKFINGAMQWPASEKIPMTGVMTDMTVRNTIEESFNIEVVRAVAKVEFVFSNPCDEEITLSALKFGPIANLPSKISIVPNYKAIGIKANDKLESDHVTADTLSFDLNSKLTANKKFSFCFYCNESLSKTDAKHELIAGGDGFDIILTVKKGEGEDSKFLTKKLKTPNITYINRNDWIRIPISVMQYDITAEAIFYPPIGGYPAVLTNTNADDTQVFIFGTEGDFAIVTKVYDKFSNLHLAPNQYSVTLGNVTGADIFEVGPTLTHTSTSLPDEITGTLSSAKGEATVEINVRIGSLTHTVPIHIKRE